MICKSCKKKDLGDVLSPEQFKKKFKVGDVITAWSTGKSAEITAIGVDRILYLDYYGQEHVASMSQAWRRLK